jgi:regulator of protease activity HflC (stomatin/prohibitin superfamily)
MKKISIFAVFAILFSVALTSCTRVSPGYTGFKYSYAGNDKGKPEIEPAVGWVGYLPGFSTVVEFPTSIQHYEGEVTTFCKLGAAVKLKVGYNYRVLPSKSADVFFSFKTDDLEKITNGFLYNTMRNVVNATSGVITLDSFITNVPAFTREVDRVFADSMRSYGFEMSQFGTVGAPEIIDPAIHQAVSNKIKAKQDAETSQQQLQISIADANKDIAKARGDSASAVIRALGEAEAIKVKQAFLNPTYVEYVKWSNANENVPRVPQYVGAGGWVMK